MSKGFKAVEWMRRRRTEIDQEDQGLSWSERSEKTLRILENDPLWKRLKSGRHAPTRTRRVRVRKAQVGDR
jgi:hypothetical protein